MAKKSEFVTFSKKRMTEDIEKFGALPESLIDLYKKRGEGNNAVECLERSLQLLEQEPKNYAAMLYVATLYEEKKEYKKALTYYKRITKAVPMMFYVWLRQGMVELLLHDTKGAQHSVMQYSYFKMGEWFPTCLIAMTFYFEDKKEVAEYFLDEMLKTGKVDQPDRIVWFRGCIKEHAGDKKAALLHYIESTMMAKEKDSMMAVKIGMLAAEKEEGTD